MQFDIAKIHRNAWTRALAQSGYRPAGRLFVISFSIAFCLLAAGPARASVIYAGDVSEDPTLINPHKKLYIGKNGIGTVDISGGSQVTDGGGVIGNKVTANGTVSVSGEGSRWDNYGAIIAGDKGTGRLIIQSGADVSNRKAYLGKKAGSDGTVTVSGQGSSWSSAGSTVIGGSGQGRLNILGGATATSKKGYVGQSETGDGAVSVTGEGSRWTVTKSVEVGKSGAGALRVGRGGVVDIGENLILGYEDGSTSILAFSIGDNGMGSIASGLVNVGGRLGSGEGTSLFDLTVDYGASLTIGDMFTLVDYRRLARNFAFSNVADDALFTTGAYTFLIDYNRPIATGDFAIVATLTAMAGYTGVPEPRAIFGFGITALFFMRRRRLA